MNRIAENNWLQKEHASSLHDGGLSGLFHVIYVWGGARSEFAATLKKGAHVQIEGEIRTREYTRGDDKRTVTEVRVLSLTKLDRPNRSAEGSGGKEVAA